MNPDFEGVRLGPRIEAAIIRGDQVVKDDDGYDCRVLWRPVRDQTGRVIRGDPVLERIV
jgi:hypothetical protein